MGETEMLKLLLPALGPTAGCVVIVWLFVRFLTNHMGRNTEALTAVCAALAALKAVVDECPTRETRR